ncbi:MAG: hypothetical protein ACKVOR_01880 [Flavobacteriales bacterium]
MNEQIENDQLHGMLQQVNNALDVNLSAEDFKSASYSVGSLVDIVVQKIQDEKSGDWTADVAYHKLRKALMQVCGSDANGLTHDTQLHELMPPANRRAKVKELEQALGVPVNILRPNNALYGTFIFLFFAGIPVFSLGWFPAVLTMVISGIVIFILSKTANNFKMKTVGLLADHLAWKNYLKDKQRGADFNREDTKSKVLSIIQKG